MERRLLGRPLHVDDRLEQLVLDARPRRRGACSGSSAATRRDRLAVVADALGGEHRLVGELEPVGLLARDVGVREHGVDARHPHRLGDVELDDLRVRMRAADGDAPEHPGRVQVARVGELAGHLRRRVVPGGRLADSGAPERSCCCCVVVMRGRPRAGRHRRSSRSRCSGRGCRTAPRGSRRRSGSARSSSAAVATTRPGRAEAALDGASTNACWTRWSPSSERSPSTVVTRARPPAPRARGRRRRGRRRGGPSRSRTRPARRRSSSRAARACRAARSAGSRPPRRRPRAARR